MTLEAIMTFAVAVGALAIKPGAGMMMVMSRAIAQGFSGVVAMVIGFSVVSLLFLGLVVFGYKFIEVDLVFISIVIKSFAAVYLIRLGVKGFQKVQDPFYVEDMKIESFFDNVTASLMLTLSNPLTIVFYAGILPTILNVKNIGIFDVMELSVVIIIVEFVVAMGYSLPLVLYRKKMPQDFLRGLTYFSSIVIIMVGLYIGYTALPSKDLLAVF